MQYYRGGKTLGCGSFACGLTIDEIIKYRNIATNWKIYYSKYDEGNKAYEQTLTDFTNTTSDANAIETFMNMYNNKLVFKDFNYNGYTNYYNETMKYDEYESVTLRNVVHLPYTILYRDDDKNIELLYLTMVDDKKRIRYFPLSQLMDGDLYKKHLKMNEIKRVELQTLAFLKALHLQGYYHFDIKLENVLYKMTNNELSIAVTDYGFLSTAHERVIKGTSNYMSPVFLKYLNKSNLIREYMAIEIKTNMRELLIENHNIAYKIIIQNFKTPYEQKVFIYKINDMYALGIMLIELYNKRIELAQYPNFIDSIKEQYIFVNLQKLRLDIEHFKEQKLVYNSLNQSVEGGKILHVSFDKHKRVIKRKLSLSGGLLGVTMKQEGGSYEFVPLSRLKNVRLHNCPSYA
jgi:serine/threonine protein kinase